MPVRRGNGKAVKPGLAKSRLRTICMVVLVIMASVSLRLIFIDRRPMASHELASIHFATMFTLKDLCGPNLVGYAESNGLLYYYGILKPVIIMWENGSFALRIPSVLCAACSVWLVYLLGATLKNRRSGLLAALLYGANTYAAAYDSFVRFYAFDTMLCLLSTYLVIQIICYYRSLPGLAPASKFKSVLLWAAYILSCAGLMLTMLVSSFLLPAHWLTMLTKLPNKRHAWAWTSLLALGTVCGGWLLSQRDQTAVQRMSNQYSPLSYSVFFEAIGQLLNTASIDHTSTAPHLQLQPNLYSFTGPLTHFTILLLALTAIWWLMRPLLGQWFAKKPTTDEPRSTSRLLVAWWLFIPMALICLFSAYFTSIIAARNFLFVLPACCLIIGCCLASQPRAVVWVYVLALMLTTPVTTVSAYMSEEPSMQGIYDYIRTAYMPEDTIILADYAPDPIVTQRMAHDAHILTIVVPRDFSQFNRRWNGWQSKPQAIWIVCDQLLAEKAAKLITPLGYRQRQIFLYSHSHKQVYLELWTFVSNSSTKCKQVGRFEPFVLGDYPGYCRIFGSNPAFWVI